MNDQDKQDMLRDANDAKRCEELAKGKKLAGPMDNASYIRLCTLLSQHSSKPSQPRKMTGRFLL